jgi:hypothetical protein
LAACSDWIRAAKGSPVTASELLVLLGRAWSRLLLYPGGLAAFTTVWLVVSLLPRSSLSTTAPAHPLTPSPAHPVTLAGSAVVLPWLALALLPLPLAIELPRQLDIVVALTLLEWPHMLAIGQELQAGDTRRLAAALNGYPPLILATLALAQSSGSLEIAALARAPDELASTSARALHWLGAIALVLALPPVLGIGPFAGGGPTTNDQRPTTNDQRPTTRLSSRSYVASIQASVARFLGAGAVALGLRLRALGLIALAALPWSGNQDSGWALPRMLAAASLIAGLLWTYERLMRGQPARSWARAYLALDAALLLALLWAAYQALQSRLA